jgi:phosphoglycolate phosphatase
MLTIANAIPAEGIRLVVFDLDGTLIDSRRDLATAVNAMLGEMGRSALPDKVVAEYVGDGAGMLVRRALGDPEDERLVEEGVERFLACYRRHMLDYTHVYDGVFEALDALRGISSGAAVPMPLRDPSASSEQAMGHPRSAAGPEADPNGGERKFAVLTNKPVNPARRICEALGLSKYFFQIYGGNSFGTKKPDPEGLRALMREAGVDPDETVMVGDSVVDVLTARNAGSYVIGCRYGLSSHTLETVTADIMVDAPSEWLMALGIPPLNT